MRESDFRHAALFFPSSSVLSSSSCTRTLGRSRALVLLGRSLLLLLVGVLAAAGGTPEVPDRWEPQLREMGFLFLHLESINAINGLNLTKDQAFNLRSLARSVEKVTPRVPMFQRALTPELEEVRKTWLQARDILLDGRPLSPALEARVSEARAIQNAVMRRTIRPEPRVMDTRCSSCHMPPGREPGPPMTVTPPIEYLMNRSHVMSVFGMRGRTRMSIYTRAVKKILTEEQMAILASFTCRLVAPEDVGDPVLTTPVKEEERALDLMRRIRQCPDNFWPVLRGGILAGVDRITGRAGPGGAEPQPTASRDDVAKAIDRVRSLKDAEFAAQKAELSKIIQTTILPVQGDSASKISYFLLLPGSAATYTQYLDRLAKEAPAAAPEPK
jgi:mono/diheme cytochrome c family protein